MPLQGVQTSHPSSNDWPYSIPSDVEHVVVWTKLLITHATFVNARITENVGQIGLTGSKEVDEFIRKRWTDDEWETARSWIRREARLSLGSRMRTSSRGGSVTGCSHVVVDVDNLIVAVMNPEIIAIISVWLVQNTRATPCPRSSPQFDATGADCSLGPSSSVDLSAIASLLAADPVEDQDVSPTAPMWERMSTMSLGLGRAEAAGLNLGRGGAHTTARTNLVKSFRRVESGGRGGGRTTEAPSKPSMTRRRARGRSGQS
ncbi:hypothetical protein L227DRAFT_608199 [Lentinus tigrinus ALCF2SS1-6]|uniref:Uncharacterized protein n=1 Tax=Lentinus tigrinus ALCF2SS1-6 TaxID=1328759 RepID=A0A5C2SIL1_9APHY|nr:hypothetical protein L227DRAFT_608199 [Lentinus tigrinus ALCF2SS1-6]